MSETPADPLIALLNSGLGEAGDHLGITYTEASAEKVVATMPVAGNRQPYGLLHGGASAALAESLGSTMAVLGAGHGRAAVGIELNITHHRSARSGLVTGVATSLHAGRSLATSEIVITDEEGHRIATARLTCMLLDAAPRAT